MQMTIDVDEAAKRLAELISQLKAGDEIVLTLGGHVVAKIIPITPSEKVD